LFDRRALLGFAVIGGYLPSALLIVICPLGVICFALLIVICFAFLIVILK